MQDVEEGVAVSENQTHPTTSATSATSSLPLIPIGASLAITEAIIQAEIAGYGDVNGGAVLTPVQATAIEKNRLELDNSLSPYAVVHGVELALQELGISGIGSLPPIDKNFTTFSATEFGIVRAALGATLQSDFSSHSRSATSIALRDGYSLKFYSPSAGEYQAAVVHATMSLRHILIDFPEFTFGNDEVNGSIAESFGKFATVDEASLTQLKILAGSIPGASTAFEDFNQEHPAQFMVNHEN